MVRIPAAPPQTQARCPSYGSKLRDCACPCCQAGCGNLTAPPPYTGASCQPPVFSDGKHRTLRNGARCDTSCASAGPADTFQLLSSSCSTFLRATAFRPKFPCRLKAPATATSILLTGKHTRPPPYVSRVKAVDSRQRQEEMRHRNAGSRLTTQPPRPMQVPSVLQSCVIQRTGSREQYRLSNGTVSVGVCVDEMP